MNNNDEIISEIEKELNRILEKYKLEPNTKEIRNKIKEELEYILHFKYAYFDKIIEENFIVKVDEENNNPSIIDSGIIRVDLTFQPKNTSERIIINHPIKIIRASDIDASKEENNFDLDTLIEKYLEKNYV